MMLPSVVSAVAATSCLVQMQFPSAYLCSVLGQRLPGIKSAYGIFGDRVPVQGPFDMPPGYERKVCLSSETSRGHPHHFEEPRRLRVFLTVSIAVEPASTAAQSKFPKSLKTR